MAHRLDPLLRPRSIAVLGASEREGTVGRNTLENLLKGGYEGGRALFVKGVEAQLLDAASNAISRVKEREHATAH